LERVFPPSTLTPALSQRERGRGTCAAHGERKRTGIIVDGERRKRRKRTGIIVDEASPDELPAIDIHSL
jgi:hypothetical protein